MSTQQHLTATNSENIYQLVCAYPANCAYEYNNLASRKTTLDRIYAAFRRAFKNHLIAPLEAQKTYKGRRVTRWVLSNEAHHIACHHPAGLHAIRGRYIMSESEVIMFVTKLSHLSCLHHSIPYNIEYIFQWLERNKSVATKAA